MKETEQYSKRESKNSDNHEIQYIYLDPRNIDALICKRIWLLGRTRAYIICL